MRERRTPRTIACALLVAISVVAAILVARALGEAATQMRALVPTVEAASSQANTSAPRPLAPDRGASPSVQDARAPDSEVPIGRPTEPNEVELAEADAFASGPPSAAEFARLLDHELDHELADESDAETRAALERALEAAAP